MSTIRATRILECDSGHRVCGHESKCRHVHGHRYRFEVTCEAPLDAVGRVVDFGVVKATLGTWIDDHLDHAYVHRHDDEVAEFLRNLGHKTYSMPPEQEPTAENLAAHVAMVGQRVIAGSGSPLRVVRVRCWETPNCYADWEAG